MKGLFFLLSALVFHVGLDCGFFPSILTLNLAELLENTFIWMIKIRFIFIIRLHCLHYFNSINVEPRPAISSQYTQTFLLTLYGFIYNILFSISRSGSVNVRLPVTQWPESKLTIMADGKRWAAGGRCSGCATVKWNKLTQGEEAGVKMICLAQLLLC